MVNAKDMTKCTGYQVIRLRGKKRPHHAVCCVVLNLPKQVDPATETRLGRSLSRYPVE